MKWPILFIGAIATTRTDRNVINDLTSSVAQAAGHSRRDDQAFSGFWNESPGKDFKQKIEKVVASDGVILDADGSDATSEFNHGVSRKVPIAPAETSSYLQRSTNTEASMLGTDWDTAINARSSIVDQANWLVTWLPWKDSLGSQQHGHPLAGNSPGETRKLIWRGCGQLGGKVWYEEDFKTKTGQDFRGTQDPTFFSWAWTLRQTLLRDDRAGIRQWVFALQAFADKRPGNFKVKLKDPKVVLTYYLSQDPLPTRPESAPHPSLYSFHNDHDDQVNVRNWVDAFREEGRRSAATRATGRSSKAAPSAPRRLPTLNGGLNTADLGGGASVDGPPPLGSASMVLPNIQQSSGNTSKLEAELLDLIDRYDAIIDGTPRMTRKNAQQKLLDTDDGVLEGAVLNARPTKTILSNFGNLHGMANADAFEVMSTTIQSGTNLIHWTAVSDTQVEIRGTEGDIQCIDTEGNIAFKDGDVILSVKPDGEADQPIALHLRDLTPLASSGTIVTFKRAIATVVTDFAADIANKLLANGIDAGLAHNDGTMDELLTDEELDAEWREQPEPQAEDSVRSTEWLHPNWPPAIARGPRKGAAIKRKGEYTTGELFNDYRKTPAWIKRNHLDPEWDIVYLRCMKGGSLPEGAHRCLWTTKGGQKGSNGGSIEGVYIETNRTGLVFERVRCADVPSGKCTRCCDPFDNAWRAGDMYKRVWGPPPYLASKRNKKANIAPFHRDMWNKDANLEVVGMKGALGTAGSGERE